jgi:HD-GYP domain-containing protein (c-di-GMP phosphodiesterase class II)
MAESKLKHISIDDLTPGMYVVGVDVPWYRTPFLSHKRLVEDTTVIDTMRRCGIRTVTIDPRKGKDVAGKPSSDGNDGQDEKDAAASDSIGATSLDQADSASAFYIAAEEAIERMFGQLMQGGPPPSAVAKAAVAKIMRWILNDREAMMTQLAVRKIKRFDHSLTAHALDTCILSLAVSVEYGLDQDTQTLLGTGALLHDAGYLRLPRNLVRNRHECTGQERALLEQHPRLGITVLAECDDVHDEVKRIVAEHHERMDGSGFPEGRRGLDISRLAQIVGIVDWYDGMVSRRGGRPAMLPNDAVRRLFLSGKEGRFDAALIETTVRIVGVYPIGSLVLLNTGEQAIVVGLNPEARLRPKVLIIKGPRGEAYLKPYPVDLAAPSGSEAVPVIARALDPAHEFVNIALYLDDVALEAAS